MNPEDMRARFHDLRRWVEGVEAQVKPIRDHYDAMVQEHTAQQQALAQQIRAAEAGLFETKNEMAMISRALNGQTGKVSDHGG